MASLSCEALTTKLIRRTTAKGPGVSPELKSIAKAWISHKLLNDHRDLPTSSQQTNIRECRRDGLGQKKERR